MSFKLTQVIFSISRLFPKKLKSKIARTFPRTASLVLGKRIRETQNFINITHLDINLKEFLIQEYEKKFKDGLVIVIGPGLPLRSGIAWNTTNLLAEISKKKKVIFIQTPASADNLQQTIPLSFLQVLDNIKIKKSILLVAGNGWHYEESFRYLQQFPLKNISILLHDIRITGINCKTNIKKKKKDDYGLSKIPSNTSRILVHSQYAKDIVEKYVDKKMIKVMQLETGVPLILKNIRQRKKPNNPIVGFAGFFDHSKDPEKTMSIFLEVAKLNPKVKLEWLGEVPDSFKQFAYKSLQKSKLTQKRLQFYGYLDEVQFRERMSKWTVAINIRQFTNGESSGTTAELAAVGTPCLISSIGSFAELPSDLFIFTQTNENVNTMVYKLQTVLEMPAAEWEAKSQKLIKWSKSHSFKNYSKEIIEMISGEDL